VLPAFDKANLLGLLLSLNDTRLSLLPLRPDPSLSPRHGYRSERRGHFPLRPAVRDCASAITWRVVEQHPILGEAD
jgi:hypothetical protein